MLATESIILALGTGMKSSIKRCKDFLRKTNKLIEKIDSK